MKNRHYLWSERGIAILVVLILLTGMLPMGSAAQDEVLTEPLPVGDTVPEDAPAEVLPVESEPIEQPADAPKEAEVSPLASYPSNTTWQTAEILAENTPISFTLPAKSQFWYAINVANPDEGIELTFSGFKANTGYLYATLYDSDGVSVQTKLERYNFGEDGVYAYKVQTAGVYYLEISSYADNVITDELGLSYRSLAPDANENNDTWGKAYDLVRDVDRLYTINGGNDVDWFKVTTTLPGEAFKVVLSGFDYTVAYMSCAIFSDLSQDANVNSLLYNSAFNIDTTMSYAAAVPGTYYVKLYTRNDNDTAMKPLKVRYEIVPGDENENNNTYDRATTLPDDVDVAYNLNGASDLDWFKFETTVPNEAVTLSFTGFETDYSNRISYYVYNGAAKVEANSSIAYNDISITHNKTISFPNPGMQYVRVGLRDDTPVENLLKLRIARGVIDANEPNNVFEKATPMQENMPVQFNLPSTNDVDWFKFTVTDPDMTVTLNVSGLPVSGGSLSYIYLYAGKSLQIHGNGASAMTYTGADQLRYKLTAPGDYYVRVSVSRIFEKMVTIDYTLTPPDANENNDSWKRATALLEGVSKEFNCPADNDVDWFKFTVTEPDVTVNLSFGGVESSGGSLDEVFLYAGEDFRTDGDGASYMARSYYENPMRYKLTAPGDYYVKVSAYNSDRVFEKMVTIEYTLTPPDANENNDSWKRATPLLEGVSKEFNCPADNDVDWFKFTVTEPDMTVNLSFGGVESSGGSLDEVFLYAGEDFRTDGDGASYMARSYYENPMRYKLTAPGDYYVKVSAYNSDRVFEKMVTIEYTLTPPDANENNDARALATPTTPNSYHTMTLPAGNDDDWFAIPDVQMGDKVNVTMMMPPNAESIKCSLYCLAAGAASSSQISYVSCSTSASKTMTATKEGAYFLCFENYNYNYINLRPIGFRYNISRGTGTPVTGLTLNHATKSIYQGNELHLVATTAPAYASNQALTWASATPEVATVDAYGCVTALTPGTAIITATSTDGGYKATCTVTVVAAIPVTGVTLNFQNEKASPKVIPLEGNIQLLAAVLPETATERGVTFSVTNEAGEPDNSVLAVNRYGKVMGVKPGLACVTATTTGGAKTATCWFRVPAQDSYPVKSVTLSAYSATLYMAETPLKLVAQVHPEYATNPNISWSSSNPEIATVTSGGAVTAVKPGDALITVTTEEGGLKAECYVSVQPARTRVTGISFASGNMDIGIYGTAKLAAIFAPTNATDQTLTWSSNNKAVATVSLGGTLTAMSVGQATITATSRDGGFTATLRVNVTSNATTGDLNNDGNADAADAMLILKYDVSLWSLTDAQKKLGDVNGDGTVNTADAILILRYDAGMLPAFPVDGPGK